MMIRSRAGVFRFAFSTALPSLSPAILSLSLLSGCGEPEEPPWAIFSPVQPDLLGAPGALTTAWADVDSDGDPDFFVGFNGSPARLYLNQSGRFADAAPHAGLDVEERVRTAAWGDFDSDGDPDLLLGFAREEGPVLALLQNEEGRFQEVTEAAGLGGVRGTTRQASWVDVDADGDLDLFVAFRDGPNALYRNDGGLFHDVASEVGLADTRRSVGAVWFDYEEDGDLDLVVANMDGDANGLFRNEGGLFSDVAASEGIAGGGRGLGQDEYGSVRPCAADVDNDGHLDLFFANYGTNGLFLSAGGREWVDEGASWGVAVEGRYDTCAFGDADHDGWQDLYVNGTVTGGRQYRDYLFHNSGRGFTEATGEELLRLDADHGAGWVDFDLDGDLDLSLAGVTGSGMHLLMENLLSDTARARSLAVRVVDSGGRATRAGAEVRIYRAGTRSLLGTRLVDTGSGYNAQSDVPVHFGLPDLDPVDIEVVFPGGGLRARTTLQNVRPDTYLGRPVVVRLPLR